MRYFAFSTFFFLAFVLSISIMSANPNYALAGGSLDGKTFSVKLHEDGKDGEATDDELIFKDGTFFSTDCEQYGFGAAPYEARSKGDTVLFKSTLTSEKEGKAEWEGKVTGDKIKGSFIWSKEGQDSITYGYEGSLKQ